MLETPWVLEGVRALTKEFSYEPQRYYVKFVQIKPKSVLAVAIIKFNI